MSWTIIVSLLITILMHELAHLFVAKKVGCGVEVFSIGLGPVLFKFNFRGTRCQIALVPLGGFCKLKDELTIGDDPTSFSNLRYRDKLKITLAGVTLNIIVGIICLLIALQFILANWAYCLYMFGSLSLILGVANLLPIPALDGSYPILLVLEKFFDKRTAYLYISRIVKVGFWILMTLNVIFLPYLIQMIIKN